MLLSAASKREAEYAAVAHSYLQTNHGQNNPVLKTMCHGPDYGVEDDFNDNLTCDMDKDTKNFEYTGLTFVKHSDCKTFKKQDHWKYKHHIDECKEFHHQVLDGPATTMESRIYHPCDLQRCWVECTCRFCYLNRTICCKQHKMHLIQNTNECIIQREAKCQEHFIDHQDNFREQEDIKITKPLLFHNGKVKTHGRNYQIGTLQFSGLKKTCKECKDDTLDHLHNHMVPHLQCKHCLYGLSCC